MNKVNITAKDDFPMDSDGMDFIKKMIHQAYKLAKLGGANYIVEGCLEVNGEISDGSMVIEGELMEFKGGQKKDYVVIVETKETVYDEEGTGEVKEYPEAYISRYATFADDGKLKWDGIKRIVTNLELDNRIASLRGEPLSIKLDYTGRVDRIPDNYMLADGRVLKTADYPDLAWFYGAENLESFKLPDLRRYFIVGYDPSHKDYTEIGSTGGAEEVTLQISNLPSHDHVKNSLFNKLSAKAGDIDDQATPSGIDKENAAREYNVGSMSEDRWVEATIQPVGEGRSFDIRPKYYTLAYIIKVKY
uniref:tail fiber protein n=1 Tax=uncultured Dysgonomonas sp. TaxID=206096 RepID=UPI00262EA22C|nr:tail fiber protein [uncultured Dysgonomonas sp.]